MVTGGIVAYEPINTVIDAPTHPARYWQTPSNVVMWETRIAGSWFRWRYLEVARWKILKNLPSQQMTPLLMVYYCIYEFIPSKITQLGPRKMKKLEFGRSPMRMTSEKLGNETPKCRNTARHQAGHWLRVTITVTITVTIERCAHGRSRLNEAIVVENLSLLIQF